MVPPLTSSNKATSVQVRQNKIKASVKALTSCTRKGVLQRQMIWREDRREPGLSGPVSYVRTRDVGGDMRYETPQR